MALLGLAAAAAVGLPEFDAQLRGLVVVEAAQRLDQVLLRRTTSIPADSFRCFPLMATFMHLDPDTRSPAALH